MAVIVPPFLGIGIYHFSFITFHLTMGDFGIKIGNTFLDLYPNTQLSYVLNTPFYLGGELGDAIPGSLVFSVKVPLSPRNNKRLRFPGLIDNAWEWIEKAECSVYTEGVALWFGQLEVVAPSTEKDANIRITINSAAALQSAKMNELDLGIFNTTTQNPFTWADNAVLNPDFNNFMFAPVWNPDFWVNQDRKHDKSEIQNHWTAAGFDTVPNQPDKPTVLPNYTPLTPFPKLGFVLDRLFQSVGYRTKNRFQTTHELKRLILYANASMTNKDGTLTATKFPLSYGLSGNTQSLFIRNLCRKFSIAPFFNAEEREVELIPFGEIYESGTAHDWTKKQLSGYELSKNIEHPNELSDGVSDTIVPSNIKDLPVFNEHPADTDGIEGIYKVNGLTYYHKNLIPTSTVGGLRQLSQARVDDTISLNNLKGKRYENGIGTLILSRLTRSDYLDYPSLSQRGKTHSQAHTSDNTTADRLLFYRGIGRNGYPFASSETRDMLGYNIPINGQTVTQYDSQNSLNWAGNDGIYNRFWAGNHQIVTNGKEIKTRILLTVGELKRFSFKQKVRLGNQECFVKSISGVLNRRGLQPADVTFVTLR
jgi:hypothetical protein